MFRFEGIPTIGPPPKGFQVETPRSPTGAFPVFVGGVGGVGAAAVT